jgi:hypothetical protein
MQTDDFFTNREKVTRRPSRRQIALWIALAVLLLALLGGVVTKVSVAMTGNAYETAMNKDYAKAILKLSGYYTETEGALGIANADTTAIEHIVKAAMTGHYGTPADFQKNGLYTAIYLAYPQTGGVTQAYHDAEAILVGSFKDYQEADLALYNVVESFLQWKSNTDILLPLAAGYPDDLLSTHVGNQPGVCCQEALLQMETVIADQNTINAVRSGVLQNIPIPTPAP